PSSYSKYDYLLSDYIIPEFSTRTIEEIRLESVETGISNIYNSNRTSKISNSMMKSIIYIVNAVLAYGTRLGYFNVGRAIFELPSNHENKKANILKPNQENVLIHYLLNNRTDNNLGIMFSLLTGMRLGEVCALKRGSIDFKKAVVHVNSTVQRISILNQDFKTKLVVTSPKSKGSNREIPLPKFLLDYIKEFNVHKIDGDLFILGKSKIPYEPRTLQYGFKTALENCKIEHKNYHSLRHTFATNCIKSGFDVKTLSEILGHASVSFTLNRYVHSDIEHKRSQMEKLEKNYKRAAQIS
ncbi:MAG: site-specific integrase, partial [Tissierellaceae bacterium]